MSEHVYACSCGRPVQHEYVEGVVPGGRMAMGRSVVVCYRCECSPSAERVQRYYLMPDAVERITGGVGLPYRNARALIPVPADHPALSVWRDFINKHGHDVGAFIMAMNEGY